MGDEEEEAPQPESKVDTQSKAVKDANQNMNVKQEVASGDEEMKSAQSDDADDLEKDSLLKQYDSFLAGKDQASQMEFEVERPAEVEAQNFQY